MAAPALFAFFLQQTAFLAHDSLHNGVVEPKAGAKLNWLGWLHGSVIFGISQAMWLDEHSKHHAMTLRPFNDPQFCYLPIWLQDKKELVLWKGNFMERFLARLLVPVQHFTLLPLCMIVGRVNLYLISFGFSIKNGKWMDVLGMLLYWCWTIPLYLLLHSQAERWLFFFISHVGVGVLHIQLLISHLAVEVFTEDEEHELQFCQFQLRTTRNISVQSGWHWFHGGLEYQIEHHLFPQMPRHNLPRVQPFVKALAKRHGVPYHSAGFFPALGVCLSHFRDLSSSLISPHELTG